MKTVLLGDACDLVSRGISPVYTEPDGITVLNQKCIRDHNIDYSLARKHDIAKKKINPGKKIQVGDVLVNSTGHGTLGRVAQVKRVASDLTVDSHITIVRPKPGTFYLPFFGYAMIMIEKELGSGATGTSGQTELPRSVLRDHFQITYPESIEEQKKVVKKLDKMLAAIDRAQANTEENLKSIQELFSLKLTKVFNELGNIQSIKEFAEVKGGKRVPKGEKLLIEATDYPYIRVSDFNDHGSVDLQNIQYVSQKVHERIARYTVSGDDLYISIAGTIGKTGIVPPGLDGANLTENACKLVLNNEVNNKYLYYFTKTKSFLDQAGLSTRTTAMPKLALVRLKEIEVPVPDLVDQLNLVKDFDNMSQQTQKLQELYRQKLDNLEELRQSILKRAFEGKL
jgi:type I restriction enzyme S subunit